MAAGGRELEGAKTVVKGSVATLIFLFLAKPVSWLYYVILGRYLAPSEYGLFFIALGVASFALYAAQLGLHHAVSRFTPYYAGQKKYGKVRQVVSASMKAVLVSSLASMILLIALRGRIADFYGEPLLSPLLVVFALSIPLMAYFMVLTEFLRGLKQVIAQQSYILGLNIVKIAATLALFVYVAASVEAAVDAYFMAAAVGVIAVALASLKRLRAFKVDRVRDRVNARKLLRFGLPLFLAGSLDMVFGWTDSLVLGAYRPTAEVGLYGAALTVGRIMPLVAASFTVMSVPILSEYYGRKKLEDFRALTRLVAKLSFTFTFPAFLLYLALPGRVISLAFSTQYAGGAHALVILALGFLAISLASIYRDALLSAGATGTLLKISSVATLLNLALNLILIPEYGMLGAAAATTTAIIVAQLLNIYYGRKVLKLSVPRDVLKSVAAGVATLAVILQLKVLLEVGVWLEAGILAAATALIYLTLLILLKSFSKVEVELIRMLLAKVGVPEGASKKILSVF